MVSDSRTLDFIELHCFREVARTGGVTSAATKLGLSKSAVSKYLSRLEGRLGVKVVERSSRRVLLTPAGEHLLPRVESLVADGELLVEQALEEKVDPSGLVRVAATPEFGALVAQRFFPEVVERYPTLHLAMTSSYTMEDLQDPFFDFAVRIGSVKDDRLVAKEIGRFGRVPVASPTFVAEHPIESPDDLGRLPCLIFSGRRSETKWTFFRKTDRDRTKVIDVEVRSSISVMSFTSLLAMAEKGLGVAYVPDFVAKDAIDKGRVVRCLPKYVSRPTPIYLAYRPGSARIRRVGAVLEMASERLPLLIAEASETP